MPFNIGSTEIFIIALVLFFVFGGKKLREWGKGIGEAGREVKKVKKEFEDGLEGPIDDEVVKIEPASKPALNKKKEVE